VLVVGWSSRKRYVWRKSGAVEQAPAGGHERDRDKAVGSIVVAGDDGHSQDDDGLGDDEVAPSRRGKPDRCSGDQVGPSNVKSRHGSDLFAGADTFRGVVAVGAPIVAATCQSGVIVRLIERGGDAT